jgi:hypothetical protein
VPLPPISEFVYHRDKLSVCVPSYIPPLALLNTTPRKMELRAHCPAPPKRTMKQMSSYHLLNEKHETDLKYFYFYLFVRKRFGEITVYIA